MQREAMATSMKMKEAMASPMKMREAMASPIKRREDMASLIRRREAMATGPAPFSEIDWRAKDLLTSGYSYDQKFSLSFPSPTGMGLATANGVKNGKIFAGDIRTQYRSGNTILDVMVDTYSNISSRLSYDVMPGTRAAISFSVPDNESSKLDVMYRHRYAAILYSIGLNPPSPHFEVSAAIGSKGVAIGGEMGYDTPTSSFTKCNAGISLNKPDFSAAIKLIDMGQTVEASYTHLVNPRTEVAAVITHRLSGSHNRFCIGSVHKVDSKTSVKTRFSSSGKVGVLGQWEWRPKSLVTVSAECDAKAITKRAPTFGLSISLQP